jgi:hypothetical protein
MRYRQDGLIFPREPFRGRNIQRVHSITASIGERHFDESECTCTGLRKSAAAQIANTISDVLEPQGVGVIIEASHHCMTTRGVHKPHTDLVTSRMLGCFRDNALTRQEFLGMAA